MADGKSTSLWIILAIILYLFLSLTYLSLPGLQYDEVNFVNAALGKEDAPFIAWQAKIFGTKLPLMIMSYIGALKSALYAPIFKVFGTSAAAVRLPVVCIGLITLLISYALSRRIFDRNIAIVGLLLLATDPTFIFANKLDWGPVSLMLLLEMASLYFMWRWMREGKRHFLTISGFLLGLGLYNKIIFAWYFTALFIAMLLLYRDNIRRLLHWRQLICFIPALLLGSLPLIAFNISVPMGTFRNEKAMTSFGLGTLHHRYQLIRGTLDGSGTYYLFNQSDVAYHHLEVPNNSTAGNKDFAIGAIAAIPWIGRSPLPFAVAGSLLFILILLFAKRLTNKRGILFIGAQLLIIAALISVTAEATGAHHVIAFYPFVFFLTAFAICEFANWLGRSQFTSGIIMGACLVPLLLTQLIVDARHLHSFQAIGGVGFWSDAIYDLTSFARANPDKNFILMDWGLGNQFALLSNGQIRYQEFVCSGQSVDNCLEPLLDRSDSFLVFYAYPFGNEVFLNTYRKAADRDLLHPHIKKAFFQRDGWPVYLVYETIHPVEPTNRSIYYKREAEDFDAKSGGGVDIKSGASNKAALGGFWGRQKGDFVDYKFNISEAVPGTRLNLRYAFAGPGTQRYHLFLDGEYLDTITLPPSHGFGYTAEEWNIFETRLGYLSRGTHDLKIMPAQYDQVVNLDYFVIRDSKPTVQ